MQKLPCCCTAITSRRKQKCGDKMSKKMPEIDLANTKKVWQIESVKKKIQKLYKDVAKDLAKQANKLPKNGDIDVQIKKNWLNQYVKSLEKEIDILEEEIYKEIQMRMELSAQAVVDANISFMGKAGLDLAGAFDTVPKNVVANLVNGKIYKGNWKLSKAIWKSTQKTQKDIYKIVAKGLASQKSAYDIAKDLEKYVNPSAKKSWDWSKVYPGTNKKIDYNAQRLARTLIQHAYQQSYRETVKYNPFITGVIWRSVFAPGRTCQLCMDRDGQRFDKGKEPLDHPMGLCYLEPEIPKTMEEIGKELARWANGEKNPAIDKYVNKAFNYRQDKYKAAKDSVKKKKT